MTLATFILGLADTHSNTPDMVERDSLSDLPISSGQQFLSNVGMSLEFCIRSIDANLISHWWWRVRYEYNVGHVKRTYCRSTPCR